MEIQTSGLLLWNIVVSILHTSSGSGTPSRSDSHQCQRLPFTFTLPVVITSPQSPKHRSTVLPAAKAGGQTSLGGHQNVYGSYGHGTFKGKTSLARKQKDDESKRSAPVTTGRSAMSLNCSDASDLVAVQVRVLPERRTAKAGVFACPGVKVMRLQVIGDRGQILHSPAKVTLTSCSHPNDTLVIVKGRHRYHTFFRFSLDSGTTRLNYSYSLHGRQDVVYKDLNKSLGSSTDEHFKQGDHRRRRSPNSQDPNTASTSTVNITDFDQGMDRRGSTAECGHSKSCIRYGPEGCNHMTCDYMLSYRVINTSDVEMELSARSSGWVAVGFSSDKFMGGGDDVMGCKRERKMSAAIVPMALGNIVKHSPPTIKDSRLQILDAKLHDQHIYCRISRPMEYKKARPGVSDLDLFNDWHQLYAYGDIDGAGRILRHKEKPRVSEHKIAMIRVTNIALVTNAASLPLNMSTAIFLVIPLILTFVGS